MIYLVEGQYLEKIDDNNLSHVIKFIFKDYPDIIDYYINVIGLLSEKPELIINIRYEIIGMLDEFIKAKDNVISFEQQIIEGLRKKFYESDKVINLNAQKIFISKLEDNDRSEQQESLDNIFNGII